MPVGLMAAASARLLGAERIFMIDHHAYRLAFAQQKHMPKLLEHIQIGELRPEVIVTHTMALEDAARGYEIFAKKQEDCRKVILTPGRVPVAGAI